MNHRNLTLPYHQDKMLRLGLEIISSLYNSIRSSAPLMQAGYERCSHLSEEGKLMAELTKYYEKHILEEMNHGEWLLNDLESIGVPRRISF